MNRISHIITLLLYLSSFCDISRAENAAPRLHYTKNVPHILLKKLASEGYHLPPNKNAIYWNRNGRHYFLPLTDAAGGCAVANIDESNYSYRIVDSYGQCTIKNGPIIKKLLADGEEGIIVKLNLHSNGSANISIDHTTAYLYVSDLIGFCRNDDAGSFSNGTRVSDAIIKFGPSYCR